MTLSDAGAPFSGGGMPHAVPYSRTLPPGSPGAPERLWDKSRAVPSPSGLPCPAGQPAEL